MARRPKTIVIDEELLEAIERTAVEDGVAEDDVIEEAVRRYFGLRGMALLDELAERRSRDETSLGDEEALALAVGELRAHRAERAAARRASG